MRKTFLNTLIKLAEKDERIYLLTADMGWGLVEYFAEKYPRRFINVGVAEQDMIGIATGLALCGKIVFIYSIANFPTLRCIEHIRNDICYHNVNVNLVAGNTGLAYGAQGSTHHATEDIAVMRALPNMTVVAPCDAMETGMATEAIANLNSPCYLRLGKIRESIYSIPPDFQIGKAATVREGKDVTLISMGWILHSAVQAAEQLAKHHIQVRVINAHTIKPLDADTILKAAQETKAIVTVEEHNIIGGLGSAVAEVLAESGEHIRFKRMGIPDTFCITAGTQDELLRLCSLTVDDICGVVCRIPSGDRNEKVFV